MSIVLFLLMTPLTLAVCWLIVAGAGRFGNMALPVRVLSVVTVILWCLLPFERLISGDRYSLYLVAMSLFQAGIVAAGILALFATPAWPRWIIWLVRIGGMALALLWGFNLLFMAGVLLSV